MITKLFGLVILGASLVIVYLCETAAQTTGNFRIFHWPAMVLTGIGPLGLVLLCSDLRRVQATWAFLVQYSARRAANQYELEADLLQKVSQRYYLSGPRAFEELKPQGLSAPFARTLNRLTMRIPVADVRAMLEREQDRFETRLGQAIALLSLGVRFSPSIGMLGTILGMVQLLASLKDPSNIGSHMSLALLTTFYGLFFSLIFWTPLQQRLESLMDSELHGYDQLLHWLELLEKRKPLEYFGGAEEPLPAEAIKS